MSRVKNLHVVTLFIWGIIHGVEPLKNVQVIVPSSVDLGKHVSLSCHYDLEHNESLYAVKWYLGEEEFYRYVPKEVPPIQVFPITGLEIDTSKSDAHQVLLKSVRHEQSGSYRCEVSADAPFFDTDMRTSHMTIVEFPENLPLIEVGKHRYEVGERIKANCSFGPSRPPSNITWFINNVQVRDQFINELPIFEDGNKRAWVKSSLETDTDASSFRNGRLKLKCIANVYGSYRRNTEVQIEEEKPRSASVMVPKDSSGKPISLNTQGNGTPDSTNDASKSSSSRTVALHWTRNFSVQFLITLIVPSLTQVLLSLLVQRNLNVTANPRVLLRTRSLRFSRALR